MNSGDNDAVEKTASTGQYDLKRCLYNCQRPIAYLIPWRKFSNSHLSFPFPS